MIDFAISLEPVAFARPRFNKGRGFNSPKYAKFKHSFEVMARAHCPEVPLKGPLAIELEFGLVPPLKAKPHKTPAPCVRPDLDNYVKAVSDSLGGFFVDDGQIVKISARKVYAWDRLPYIKVRIVEVIEPK